MGRIDIDQATVLQAVIDRLQAALKLSDRQCYPTARPQDVPAVPIGGDYFVTVSPGGGTFDLEEQVPGVAATELTAAIAGNVTESSDVTVTAYSRIKTDSTGHDRDMLMDATRGLLPIKKAILSAMCGQDLEDADGNTFLRQLIYAQGCSAPDIVQLPGSEATYGRLSIMFGVSWDWDLTT
jgi:hypothetical protein